MSCGGRIEIRAFSVEGENIYRLLYDTAVLGAAFFASQRRLPRDARDGELIEQWKEFSERSNEVFQNNGIDLSLEPDALVEKLLGIHPAMRKLVRESTRNIRVLIRK